MLREQLNGDGPEKYLTTHHQRDTETGLDYRGARYYDSDVARFLSLDPLAADYASWSAYNYVLGNPISLVDPTGKSPDDIYLDQNGKVERIVQTDEPNRFFDQCGDPLQVHDPDAADSRLLAQEFTVGDQILFNVSGESFMQGMLAAGLGPLTQRLAHIDIGARMFSTGLESWWGGADFAFAHLKQHFPTDQAATGSVSPDGGAREGGKGYFRFSGSDEMYNLMDAGNYMWGAWMNLNGYSLKAAQRGAQISSILSGSAIDTEADQNALSNGYDHWTK